MTAPLFSVDVEAAIRKISASQLARPEMKAVEVVRSLCRSGARALELCTRSDVLTVRAPGAVVNEYDLELLASIVSRSSPLHQRYRSLLELEERGQLLWLAFATGVGFEVDVSSHDKRTLLSCSGGDAMLSRQASQNVPSCTVKLRHTQRSLIKTEAELLRLYLRYCRLPVTLDGTDLRQAQPIFSDSLMETIGGKGFHGWVRVTADEDYSVIRWVVGDVLSSERYSQLAGGIAHEAVIYSDPSGASSGSGHRQRVIKAVRETREAVVAGLHEVFADVDDEEERRRMRSVLFTRAIVRRDVGVLGQARVFDLVGGGCVSVSDLRQQASEGPLEVAAVESGRRSEFSRDGALRLDSQGRRLVTELLALPITCGSVIGTLGRRCGMLEALRAGALRAGVVMRRCAGRLLRGRVVESGELRDQERRFLLGVEALYRSGRCRMEELSAGESLRLRVCFVSRGRLPASLLRTPSRAPRLVVPRPDPMVQRMVQAFGQDSTTLYPALDLLLGGRDAWGSERRWWRAKWLKKTE